ncbi:MAG: malto-oligosyltrehalose trehalohydrolase [Acetobacteraceae bacterium]
MTDRFAHALPFGAMVLAGGITRFRLWAPSAPAVTVEVEGQAPVALRPEQDGYFAATVACGPGSHYRYRLPDGLAMADPAARAQVGGVHGASVVVDPCAYAWRHADWSGRPWHETVLYEVHAGLLGGFRGVMGHLPRLATLGVTAVELMPVAACPGRRNWGYDGVLAFAPDEALGTPDELKALVDAAHGLGLMVFLDVVYNHFGPDGNDLHACAAPFFRADAATPWGEAIDFRQQPVRDFFIHNALYWLNEYRFDGLRFDAVHMIVPPEALPALGAAIRRGIAAGEDAIAGQGGAGPRQVHLVVEHDGNRASLLRAGDDGRAFDAQWNDDFHHCLHRLLTGDAGGYYADYPDPAAQLARCLAEGFAWQGEASPCRDGRARGEPSAYLPPVAFVSFLQNHDQIGNRAFGKRLTQLADPAALEAAALLLLLGPQIPLLFMGEDWGCTTPFLYFTDHVPGLAALVREGRRREFARFPAFADPASRAAIPDPNDPATFLASIPDPAEAGSAVGCRCEARTRRLLALRARHIVPGLPGCRSLGALAPGVGAVRAAWRLGDGGELCIVANLAATPTAIEPPAGEVLCESAAGIALAVRTGRLPPRAAVAFLASPAA